MTDDIFHDWKKSRFIIADFALLDQPEIVVVLTDIGFWSDHVNELVDWCKVYGGEVKGMTVSFDSHEQLMLFSLRWA